GFCSPNFFWTASASNNSPASRRLAKAASTAVFQKERTMRQQLAALPRHLRILMADEHGLHYLIADKE
ncbi:MAG: hypothetical protein ABSF34_19105, partial [Verrucomicrobiota bacterium]